MAPCLSPRKPTIDPRPARVEFVVNGVTVKHIISSSASVFLYRCCFLIRWSISFFVVSPSTPPHPSRPGLPHHRVFSITQQNTTVVKTSLDEWSARRKDLYLTKHNTHQHPVHTSILFHTRHMPCQSHSSRFYHPHNIGYGVQIIQLLIIQLSPFPRPSSLSLITLSSSSRNT